MYIKSTLILIVFLCCNVVMGQEVNPLLDMVGRPYSEYHDTYAHLIDSLFYGDSLGRATAVRLIEEAAAVDVTGEWDLICRFNKINVRFYESRGGGFIPSADYSAEDFVNDLLALSNEAGVKGFPLLHIWTLWYVAMAYNLFIHDYERAFTCFSEVALELESRTTKEFPLRPYCYREMANLYFTFREYDEAAFYYHKMAEDPDAATNYYKPLYSALNGLGGCYRNMGDMAKSDSCYRRLLSLVSLDEANNYMWGGITACDIGYNYHLQGDDDTALEWLVPAIETITRENDAAYVSLRATTIADIYLKKNAPQQAKRYMDMALEFHQRSRLPQKESRLFYLLGRYYFYIGDKTAANAFLDSAMTAVNRENDAFSGLVLRRLEQRLRVSDRTLHQQVLNAEKTRSQRYKETALFVSFSLAIILVLLFLTLVYARRTHKAYRSLVIRSQHWAGVGLPDKPPPQDIDSDPPLPHADERDHLIMAEIEKAITEKRLFTRTDLTLDTLEGETGYNSYYISLAVNRCTGMNVNTYINEYRVKEAIRILSNLSNSNLTIEEIAVESGFNDRQALHRTFKKMTGLSPGNFRKNIHRRDE